MKLIFIGTGSAFTVGYNNYHSNILIENNSNHKLLIDCGSDARFACHELGLTYRDITDVYISHLHYDHVGGLEWLAFCRKFDPNCSKPNLYISSDIIDDLWEKTLSGGMRTIEEETSSIDTFFEIKAISPKKRGFEWQNITFKLIKTLHFIHNSYLMPSYGLFFTANNTKILITTDTRFNPKDFKPYYEKADVIFHDCETISIPSNVHAHYDELKTLSPKIKAKTWLYHYNPGELPDAIKDGFLGFVKKGQSFDF